MFGERLKEIRKSKGFTLEELAERYNEAFSGGLNKGTLSKYENNKQEPMISVVNNLSSLLDVQTDYLLGREIKTYGPKENYLYNMIKGTGLSLEAFSSKCNISERELHSILTDGISTARGHALVSICRILGIQTKDLSNIEDDEENLPAREEIIRLVRRRGRELSSEDKVEIMRVLSSL